jgi:phosphatidate cytidylyltransferase
VSVPDASRPSSLLLRILSTIVFIPILLLANAQGGLAYVAFMLVIVGVSLYEFYGMTESKGLAVPKLWGILSGLFLCLALSGRLHPWLAFPERWLGTSAVCLILGLLLLLGQGKSSAFLPSVCALLAGAVYVALPLGCFLLLREMGEEVWKSKSYALLPYALTWLCDTFAYGVGRTLGRHKLVSTISPNKTVEGAIGGVLGAVAAGFLSKLSFASYLGWVDAIALGVLVGIFGQFGDLIESAMKRDAGIKDTSRIIPGHGGVLDRFDSFLFTVPLIYFYLRFFVA